MKKIGIFLRAAARGACQTADHLLPPRHTPNNTVTLTAAGEQLVGNVMPTLHTGTDIAAESSLPSLPRSFHNLSAGRGASAMLPDSCVSYCKASFLKPESPSSIYAAQTLQELTIITYYMLIHICTLDSTSFRPAVFFR